MPPERRIALRAKLIAVWQALRASYWFIPSLMAAAAIVLSVAMVTVDDLLGDLWVFELDWMHVNEPEGARLLLSTIAGSMIGVAGVTFSITIAAVAFASGQFGPRILASFMRDRINQVTLGTFVATFLYCVLVLRTIDSSAGSAGVPHLAALVGVGFAVASIGVLIQFIHHIADSLNSASAMSAIGSDLRGAIETLYPERIGEAGDEAAPSALDGRDAKPDGLPIAFARHAVPIPALGQGYVQALSAADLMATAVARDVVIRVVRRPGDFAADGRPIAYAWPPDRVDADAVRAVQGCFALGRRRTPHQDVRLLVDQLVDMAGRALSPGINDPQTAIGCLQWLGVGLSEMARRRAPRAQRTDEAGTVRVVSYPLTFADFAEATLGRLRPYFERDRNAALAMLGAVADVMLDAGRRDDRLVLVGHAERLVEGGRVHGLSAADIGWLEQRLTDIKALIEREPGPPRLADLADWMQGHG
ncbi:MAG: DUF2254 domain-containing protein [Alphaproteobacteria bacterium]